MHSCDESALQNLDRLFVRYGLSLQCVADQDAIPGSFWGESEAGLVGQTIYVRRDTPVHSALHEACHVLCMDSQRRNLLHTDAGGDYAEEDAVCYLQITLAAQLGLTTEAICADMDAWGYTFRLGSALAWYRQDAETARDWLVRYGLLTATGELTWQSRRAD